MGSQILRPTIARREKGEWVIQGPWGRRYYPAMSKVDFYAELRRELIDSLVLPPDVSHASNKYHSQITMTVMQSSWIGGRWVMDESFAGRLKRLRQQAGFTQEQLAEKSSLDVGTVRQLEQGTRTKPLWQTVCALAYGLGMTVVVFVGTDGWQARESTEDAMRRDYADRIQIIEADIMMRLEQLGRFLDGPTDLKRKAEMKSMNKIELERLAYQLKRASTGHEAITMIVAAICASKDKRQAEENAKYDAFATSAHVDMTP